MSSLSALFARPLLIYDDKCYSCTRFAQLARSLSRGWIRIAGHYNSPEAARAKEIIFPPGYDSTGMFWLVNRSGAFGARSGLVPLAKEIVIGIFKRNEFERESLHLGACEYGNEMTCYTSTNTMKRLAGLLRHGAEFRFQPK